MKFVLPDPAVTSPVPSSLDHGVVGRARSGSGSAGEKPYLENLSSLRSELRSRGFFVPDTRRVLLELAGHLLLVGVGLTLFVAVDDTLVRVAATPILATGLLGISTNTHTSSHYATSRRRWVNELLTLFGYSLILGLPATYWWNKHVVVHHHNPNVLGLDDDIDLMPFFAITERDRNAARGLARLYYSIQVFLIPIGIGMNSFNIQRQGFLYLARVLRDPERRLPIHWIDVGVSFLHFTLWLLLPMLFFSPWTVVGFYLYRNVVLGYALFIAFAPAHFPRDAACADESAGDVEFALKQTATVVNFRTGRIGRFVCAGVQYQIEHHLFLGASHTRYPEMSRFVEEFCRRHGYPYRTLGWLESLGKTIAVFAVPKPVELTLRRVEHPTS